MSGSVYPVVPQTPVPSLIRACCRRLSLDEASFATALHRNVVAMSPRSAAVLADGGLPLCARIGHALLQVATDAAPGESAEELLRWIGEANHREGLAAEEYVAVGHAVLRAAHELHPGEWTSALSSAWVGYFVWARTHMLTGAAAAARADEQALAERAALEAQAGSPGPVPAGQPPGPGSAGWLPGEGDDLAVAGSLIDAEEDDEDEDGGYGHLMMTMTRPARRERDLD
jgi:hypothetical protein